MKKGTIVALVAICVLSVAITSCNSVASTKMNNEVDSVSYALGMLNGDGFGKNLATVPGEKLNYDILLATFTEAVKGKTDFAMTPEIAQQYVQEYFQKAQTKVADDAKQKGQAFLDENKTKAGVITTESGLQYRVETEGSGEKPAETDNVKVHYKGTLLDGTTFDSSYERGEPATFGVNQVIKGWTEALKLMPTGSKYTLWIPSDLAYGPTGSQAIGPNETLVFEVELIEIVK